jgi:hypothetical protein
MALEGFAERTLEEIIGYGVGGAVTPVVEWLSRPIAYKVNSENPNLVLDPQSAAVAQVRLHGTGYDGTSDAAASGLNGERYGKLLAAAMTPPSTGELLELLRRAKLTEEQVRIALVRGGLAEEWIDAYLNLRAVLLSPADLAMARQQGFITDDESRTRSALQGVDAQDADLLFELSGLPPGADTAVELLARGEIGEDLFAQMIREGHTKTKYIPQMLALRWQPLSASVAAEALIRERISEAEAVAIAEKNRIQKDDFLLWSNMLGRPMPTGEALTLVRRGEMNASAFREVVARSDVRTEYTDDLLKLKRVLPPLFQMTRLVASGAIDDETATGILLDEGYDAVVAHGVVRAAHSSKTSATKNLAASQIDSLYESGLESRDWALTALVGLGYDQHEAEWHLELLDAKRLIAALQSDLNLIHREYVSHKIDEATASQELDQLQIAATVRDSLLQTWDSERTANIARLTNAQIGAALKGGFFGKDDAVSRWMHNGYTQDDAHILAELHTKTPWNEIPA